jgi:tetratricopeptide (TPR) repeat protein
MDFKKVASVLIATVTVIAAVVAFLQSDAGNRDNRAGRDANIAMVQAIGVQTVGLARYDYDVRTAYQRWDAISTKAYQAQQREDDISEARYLAVKESLMSLSPVFQPPYFDEETEEIDTLAYEVDLYLREYTRLREQFTAASQVKEAWSGKSSAYVLHLTFLAVSLFLMGLSVTIELRTKWIFAVVGMAMAGVGTLWAAATYAQPVADLREVTGAIDAYVEGEMLRYMGKYEEALVALDRAIALVPDYVTAYVSRAGVYNQLGNFSQAIADYERAIALGNTTPPVVGELAFTHYRTGAFERAIAINTAYQDGVIRELWMQFDIGAAYLALGRLDDARQAYDAGITEAIRQVTTARENGTPIPSDTWWSLDIAGGELNNLIDAVNGEPTLPKQEQLPPRDVLEPVAREILQRLKSTSVSLELYQRAPLADVATTIGELEFGQPLYDVDGNFTGYDYNDTFAYGINEIDVYFTYTDLQKGQELLAKVYVDGIEEPSWRVVTTWDGEPNGEAQIPLAVSYSSTFVFAPSYFMVELYVDGVLKQIGFFSVVEEDEE